MLGPKADMIRTYHEHPRASLENRSTLLSTICLLVLVCALAGFTGVPTAWADAPAASSDGDQAISSSAWQAKPKDEEDKANIARAIQQEAYAQQGESGSTGNVGPYYAIEKRFVTDIEDSFEQAPEFDTLATRHRP